MAVDAGTQELVRRRASNRCEYCLLRQEHSRVTHHIEHIVAKHKRPSTRGATDGAGNELGPTPGVTICAFGSRRPELRFQYQLRLAAPSRAMVLPPGAP